MATKVDGYELRFTNGGEPSDTQRENLGTLYAYWREAKDEGSSDEELENAQLLIEELLRFASIEVDVIEVEQCDECEEEATEFWPNLKKPVQLCASCEHDARRSGWEPGR